VIFSRIQSFFWDTPNHSVLAFVVNGRDAPVLKWFRARTIEFDITRGRSISQYSYTRVRCGAIRHTHNVLRLARRWWLLSGAAATGLAVPFSPPAARPPPTPPPPPPPSLPSRIPPLSPFSSSRRTRLPRTHGRPDGSAVPSARPRRPHRRPVGHDGGRAGRAGHPLPHLPPCRAHSSRRSRRFCPCRRRPRRYRHPHRHRHRRRRRRRRAPAGDARGGGGRARIPIDGLPTTAWAAGVV